MDQARDRATDQRVRARDALTSRRYRCGVCNAPVHLRVGNDRRPHFAHASGEADPTCHEYFPSSVAYTGRRMLPLHANRNVDSGESEDLLFAITESGPRLFVSLPPAHGTGIWTGSVDIDAYRVSRRMTRQHLEKGQMVDFELWDGQWTVKTNGGVSADYESRLDLGTNCLESALNVFDAMHSPAPRVGPTRAVRLGDSLWVITRQASFTWDKPDSKIRVDRCSTMGGWHVEYVEIPRKAAPELVARMSRWLQRPIRPARACVFVASPWPSAYTPAGIAIYPLTGQVLEIESDQSADLELRDSHGQVEKKAQHTKTLCWDRPIAGLWTVAVNGDAFFSFEICASPPALAPLITVTLEGGATRDLFQAQVELDRCVDSVAPRAVIRWAHPSLSNRISFNGSPIDDPKQHSIDIPAGTCDATLSACNFGALRWPARPQPVERTPNEDVAVIYARARWVLSRALPLGSASGITMRVPSKWRWDAVVGALQHRRWPIGLQAQLQVLQQALRGRS